MTRARATLTALAQALSKPTDFADSLRAALATVAGVLGLETGWVCEPSWGRYVELRKDLGGELSPLERRLARPSDPGAHRGRIRAS